MDYNYIAYTPDKKVVKGKLSASSEEAATGQLSRSGYQVVSLKSAASFFKMGGLSLRSNKVAPKEIVVFSRQLALLLSSGVDVVTALDLLQGQISNAALKKVLAEVTSDIRGGMPLSQAMGKHPKVFPAMYYRALSAGEQAGSMESVLRQMAEYMERSVLTTKKIKGALTYPAIVAVIALAVISLMVLFVIPTFGSLYATMGAKMPVMATMLLSASAWFKKYVLYVLVVLVVIVIAVATYIKTPAGSFRRDSLLIRAPVIGRIIILTELSRVCRTMALLFRVGLPLPDIMTQVIQGSTNQIMAKALTEVQQELIRGEGLSKPMEKRPVFLPLMVQMIAVGEETGHLDSALSTVAESYETEADDKISAAVGMIQPAITLIIGAVVGLIAVVLMQTMYSIYSQISV